MIPHAYRRESNAQSPLQIYLHDINDTPLLSAEEERELAERVAMGDPHARDHMVKANLRLVVNIARGYLGKGLSLEDLIEEGNLGLMRAVEGFDGMMDTRFSTYASYWIKQSIRRAVMNNGKPIRLPAYMVSLLSKWKRVTTVLTERLGRPPTPEEVGKALRLSKKKIGIVAKAIRVNNLTPHTEDSDEDGHGARRRADRRPQQGPRGPADRVRRPRSDLRAARASSTTARPPSSACGSASTRTTPMTLREVGENLGLTRERVRQLESQALLKLVSSLNAAEVRIGN